MARMLAEHCEFVRCDGDRIELARAQAHKHLLEKAYTGQAEGRAARSISAARCGCASRRGGSGKTPAEIENQERQAKLAKAIESIDADPFVRELVENFDARREGSHRSNRFSTGDDIMMKGQLAGLMKQAQQMQENMKKAQEELAAMEVEGQAGAGMVKVVMTCRHDVKRVTIDPSLMGDDKDMLEDLIAAAVNDAVRRVETDDAGKDGRADLRARPAARNEAAVLES